MNDYKTIIKCLRCASTGDNQATIEDCKQCPYVFKELMTDERFKAFAEPDGYCYSCDVDMIALDAAEALEKLLRGEQDE